MTELTNKDVKKIAKLSRIEYSEEAIEKITPELNRIMNFIEQLQEVNTDSVEPMSGVGSFNLRVRENDEVDDGNIQEEILQNAQSSKFGCFAVPKVVDNS